MNKHENLNSPENLVSDILNHKIYLKNISDISVNAIEEEIGAFQKQIAGRTVWLITFTNDSELAKKLHELNELGFLFIGEPAGWPPAEIFDRIRKKGLLNDNFKEVRWRGPGDWFITER
ncbi:MAG TPA: hypothetical protein VJ987_12755 [Anaerolineales bacterium]|nr:hypothetical protein [Anaerolineales bacterium]